MTLLVTIGLAMTATSFTALFRSPWPSPHWLHANGTTIAGILVLITLLRLRGHQRG